MKYRTFKIPKKSGGSRKITAPDKELKMYQKRGLRSLENYFNMAVANTNIKDVSNGFLTGKNVVTAAQQHIGFKTTIMLDLTDFFDTVHISMIPKGFRDPNYFKQDGFCGQSFVTSPMLANIASLRFLSGIKWWLEMNEPTHVFTIYADDLQISVNTEDRNRLDKIVEQITKVVGHSGFIINSKKTRYKYAKYGYRRILGINVGEDHYRATRKTIRKIRAANHQSNWSSKGGLTNWANCNLPNTHK